MLRLPGAVGRATAFSLVVSSSPLARASPHPCPDQARNLKKEPGAARQDYAKIRLPCNYFLGPRRPVTKDLFDIPPRTVRVPHTSVYVWGF